MTRVRGGGGRVEEEAAAGAVRRGQVFLHRPPDAPGLPGGVPELVAEGAGLDEVAHLGIVIASGTGERQKEKKLINVGGS